MNAAAPPTASGEFEYVGFWLRFFASVIDTLWVTPVVVLLGFMVENASTNVTDQLLKDPAHISVAQLSAELIPTPIDFVVQYLVPAVLIVLFWMMRNATPGKMVLNARIVDADTGAAPTRRQLLIRYLGYYVSLLPLFLGFIWIGIDPRKQGWHDKMAHTVVVRPRLSTTGSVKLPGRGVP